MRTTFILLFCIAGLSIFSCKKKKVHCDNAALCVKNISTDSIAFGWGSNILYDTLPPGHSTCKYVGEVTIDDETEVTPIVPFSSSHGDYNIEMRECNQVQLLP